MSSHFFFSCCNSGQAIDPQESNNSVSRNIISKNKTYSTLMSPKASLKSLSFQRNINFNQNSQSNNIHLASTVDIACLSQPKIAPLRSNPNNIRIQRSVEPRTIIIQKRSPSIPTLMPVHERAIHFSYKNPQKQQTAKQNPNIDIGIQKLSSLEVPQLINLKPEKQKQIISQQIIKQCEIKQQPKQKQKQKQKQIEEVKESQKKQKKFLQPNFRFIPTLSANKYILGGSKFTVLSQEQIEQINMSQSKLRMEQSAIIMNVFNPTKSQMKNWSLKPSIVSMPQSQKQLITKQSQYKN